MNCALLEESMKLCSMIVHIVTNILRGGDIAGVASFGGGDVTKMAATRKQKNAIISGNIRPIAIL